MLKENMALIESKVSLHDRNFYFKLVKEVSFIQCTNKSMLSDIKQLLSYVNCVEGDLLRVQRSSQEAIKDLASGGRDQNLVKKLRAKIEERRKDIKDKETDQNDKVRTLTEKSQRLRHRLKDCSLLLRQITTSDKQVDNSSDRLLRMFDHLAPRVYELDQIIRAFRRSRQSRVLNERLN